MNKYQFFTVVLSKKKIICSVWSETVFQRELLTPQAQLTEKNKYFMSSSIMYQHVLDTSGGRRDQVLTPPLPQPNEYFDNKYITCESFTTVLTPAGGSIFI